MEQNKLYESLENVFDNALNQAESGKGKERHVFDSESFEEQQIVVLNKWCGSGAIFQACKKAIESFRLIDEEAIKELLGAINYLAAEVITRQNKLKQKTKINLSPKTVEPFVECCYTCGHTKDNIICYTHIKNTGYPVKIHNVGWCENFIREEDC